MQIAKYIEIKNTAGKTVAIISPKADGLKDAYVDCRLNGESTLEFSLPSNCEKINEITPESQIWVNNKVYSLLVDEAVEEVMDESGKQWTKFMPVERWHDLDTSYAEPYISNDPSIPYPADLAVIIVGGGTNLSGGLYTTGTASHALYAVLNGSGWTLGICDVTGIHDLEAEKVSRLELIKQIQSTWDGYLIWDSVNKVVHLRNGDIWQNYTGFQVRYAKNLKHISRTQTNKLVTKLYCFGKDDLDIASVNDGLKYLTDFSYTSMEYTSKYINTDIEDVDELKQKGLAELAINCKPRYNYSAKVVDLRTLPEYNHEEVALGDMVDIISPKSKINEKIRLIQHKYNVFQPWDCEFELGDPLERFVEKLKTSFDTSSLINNTFDSSGNISGWKLVDGSVINNKIANAALDASKFNTKQIILAGDTWNDNTPSSGYVSWIAHKLFYDGVEYSIIAGNTNKKYVVWQKAINSTIYQCYTEDEFALINLAESDFIIAVNNSGLHDIAWYSRLARQFIGSVFIADAAIKEANIANLAVSSAKIADAAITNAKIGTAAIKSANIEDLAVTTFKIGDTAITEEKLANLAVTGDKIANLAITNAKIANATIESAKIVSLSADKITAGTITATIEIQSPIIRSGVFYGTGSNSAFLKVGVTESNFADLSLFRGGATNPLFQIFDGVPVVLLKALNSSNVLNTFLETTGDTSTPKGTWDFSSATVSGISGGDSSSSSTIPYDVLTKIQKYLSSDTSTVNYVSADGENFKIINATTDGLTTRQAENNNGDLLYWTDNTHTTITTTVTSYSVYIYTYIEISKAQIELILDGTDYNPQIILGAGDGMTANSGKAIIKKHTSGVEVNYYKSNTGDARQVILDNDNIRISGNTGATGLRNIGVGTVLPASGENNELFILKGV